jgi:hypothetical protein
LAKLIGATVIARQGERRRDGAKLSLFAAIAVEMNFHVGQLAGGRAFVVRKELDPHDVVVSYGRVYGLRWRQELRISAAVAVDSVTTC